jgi:exodeoxyribonuclease V alpha subunit
VGAGLDPVTGVPRGRLRRDGQAVRFVEVIVNGPKSWSLAAELHPNISAACEAAQDRAATQILAWLADRATTRVGPRGGQVHLHLQINTRVRAQDRWLGLHTVGGAGLPGRDQRHRTRRSRDVPDFRAALAGHGYTLTADGEITQLAEYVGPFSARAGRSPGISTGTRPSGAPPIPVGNRGRRYAAPGMPAPGPTTGRTRSSLPRITCCGSAGCTNCWSSATAIRTCTFRLQGCGAVSWTGIAAWPRCVPARGARSAWNPADIRGEVEQLIARSHVVADAAVRTDLAEDLTARTLAACVPLLPRPGLPEHIRALTSRHVLDVESDLGSL